MFGSRVLLAGAAAMVVSLATAVSAFAAPVLSSGVSDGPAGCGEPGKVKPGNEYNCDVDGLRITVRAIDRDCVLLVRVDILDVDRRTNGLTSTVVSDNWKRHALAVLHIRVGDCDDRDDRTSTIPAPVVIHVPVSEAPVPPIVTSSLPVTH